jgi:hypothetical protein
MFGKLTFYRVTISPSIRLIGGFGIQQLLTFFQSSVWVDETAMLVDEMTKHLSKGQRIFIKRQASK